MLKPSRGRPRQYDPEQVLDSAIAVFSTKGYTGTSLDDLASAMGMNRPSLYLAFGDKESLYRQALARFVQHLQAEIGRVVIAEPNLQQALRNFYAGGLDVYFANNPPLGCFMFCTAPVEALVHPEIQQDMRAVLEEVDQILEEKFQQAQQDGQYPAEGDAKSAAKVAQAVLHSLAIRARAGESRAVLDKMTAHAVKVLCGAG